MNHCSRCTSSITHGAEGHDPRGVVTWLNLYLPLCIVSPFCSFIVPIKNDHTYTHTYTSQISSSCELAPWRNNSKTTDIRFQHWRPDTSRGEPNRHLPACSSSLPQGHLLTHTGSSHQTQALPRRKGSLLHLQCLTNPSFNSIINNHQFQSFSQAGPAPAVRSCAEKLIDSP